MDSVYSALRKEFGLREKHVSIMRCLEDKKLSADDLCKTTGIAAGRIYEYLNVLVEKGVVQRSQKRPYVYSIPHLKRSIIRFTQNKIDDLMRLQSEMMIRLQQGRTEAVELIPNAMVLTQCHINMVLESSTFKVVCVNHSFPYVLYPDDFNSFMKLRSIVSAARQTISRPGIDMAHLVYEAYINALESDKQLIVVLDKGTFDFHIKLFREQLTRDEFKKFLHNIIRRLDERPVRCVVVDETSPLQIDISERRVCVSMKHLGTSTGIVLQSPEAVQFFAKVFDRHVKQSVDVRELVKKFM
jgi:predicted transcriptional regulator